MAEKKGRVINQQKQRKQSRSPIYRNKITLKNQSHGVDYDLIDRVGLDGLGREAVLKVVVVRHVANHIDLVGRQGEREVDALGVKVEDVDLVGVEEVGRVVALADHTEGLDEQRIEGLGDGEFSGAERACVLHPELDGAAMEVATTDVDTASVDDTRV
jgi:hypothetical protein